jgi:DNA invertase Pin-like site-specific DNA recombinase
MIPILMCYHIALKAAGWERVYKEKISASKERPELAKLNEQLREGDTIVI